MSRSLLGHLVVGGAVALVACGSDFTSGSGGGGAGPGGSGGATSTSSGAGGGGDCPPNTIPIPPIPNDWTGPIQKVGGSSPVGLPSCSGLTEWTLHSGLEFEDAACTCECGTPECQATISYHATSCTGAVIGTDQVFPPCSPINPVGAAGTWESSAACEASVATVLPEVSWQHHLRACAVFEDGSEDSCAPPPHDPFSTALCILREGHGQQCPDGYPDRLELFEDYQEGRNCPAACECSTQTILCSATVEPHSGSNCQDPGTVVGWQAGNCITSMPFSSVEYDGSPLGGACQPPELEGTGMATERNPFTVCCTPS